MKQAIAGVAPSESSEATVMIVWPSIAAYSSGRFLGRLYSIHWPDIYIFRLGNLLALASIPHALALYAYRLLPSFFGLPLHGTFYKLTNRRILELRNEVRFISRPPFLRFFYAAEIRSVRLDRFDTINIEVQAGQKWFDAGDLVFTKDGVETFRLLGVSRPNVFRHICWNSHMAYVGVGKAREKEAAHV
jgi:hypothetical protein